jgi:hypothetical protein
MYTLSTFVRTDIILLQVRICSTIMWGKHQPNLLLLILISQSHPTLVLPDLFFPSYYKMRQR